MDVEIRLFVFDENGGVAPLDKQRFDAAVEHREPLPEFKGQRVKLAGALLMRQPDRPDALADVYGQFVYFDDEGFVDEEKMAAATSCADKNLGRDYHNAYVWVPGAADKAKIEAVLQ